MQFLKIINIRILHEHEAPVSTSSECFKYNPPKTDPACFWVHNFVQQEGILLAHAYYNQFYRSRLGCYTIGPMYLKHSAEDGRLSAFSQLWDPLPYPSSSDRVLRHSFSYPLQKYYIRRLQTINWGGGGGERERS